MPYRGRFAPSPTGELHLGSLVTALASYLDARAAGGQWLIRIDDIDPPRSVAGATEAILELLAALGLQPDEPTLFQSARNGAYEKALERLAGQGLTYFCRCSRRDIQARNLAAGKPRDYYDGRCRHAAHDSGALRVIVGDQVVRFCDRLQSEQSLALGTAVGDFIVKRKDGLIAYQLACALDEGFQHITHVVRGDDLLDSTPRQLYLQAALNVQAPDYCHIPVLRSADGRKLSKQFGAAPVRSSQLGSVLPEVLQILGLTAPKDPSTSELSALLDTASGSWSVQAAAAAIERHNRSVAAQQNELR